MTVRTHAAIRMCERGLGVDNPTPIQIEHASELILESMMELHPEVEELQHGHYVLQEYSIIVVVRESKVITVKNLKTQGDEPKLNGGLSRSGNKYAKKIRKHSDEIEDIKRNGKKTKRRKRDSPRPRE